jgi:hypothetical protein
MRIISRNAQAFYLKGQSIMVREVYLQQLTLAICQMV